MEKGEESLGKGSIEAVGVDQSSVFAVNPSDYTGSSRNKIRITRGGNLAYGGQGGGRGGMSGTGTKACYHCGRPGHLKSSCWLLHGYPANWESKATKEKGKLGFSGRRTGGTTGGAPNQFSGLQRGGGLGQNQFGGLQAHHAQLGQSSLGPNQISGLQAHQGQPSNSGLNRLSKLPDSAFHKLLDFLGPDDDNMHPNTGKNFISRTTPQGGRLEWVSFKGVCTIFGVWVSGNRLIVSSVMRMMICGICDLGIPHDKSRLMAGLPTEFWGECVTTAAHLINLTPTQILGGKSSYEVLFGKSLGYSNLKVRFFTDTKRHVCRIRSQGESRLDDPTGGEGENGLSNPLGPMGSKREASNELEHTNLTDGQSGRDDESLTEEVEGLDLPNRSRVEMETAEQTLRRSD
ncbi:hypothetical protein CRG98_007120 [Punica granatum]|uniref:CCHC-type domain-containing protein n=1 Tax=Punica granatum TaxID=22663 RepID=A0A2I0KVM3_PUNGR|nr:hypothetical protein CRG98_007120 [Punica granatum]